MENNNIGNGREREECEVSSVSGVSRGILLGTVDCWNDP